MDPLIFVHLALPNVKLLASFDSESKLLTTANSFQTFVVLGTVSASVQRSPELLGIFRDVESANGKFSLEIAFLLPDFVPALDGQSEAILQVPDDAGTLRTLCVSNRMSRFYSATGDVPTHALAPRTSAYHGSATIEVSGKKYSAAEELLKTMVAMRFEIHGESAQIALESHLQHCTDTLFGCTNKVLQAFRAATDVRLLVSRPVSRASIPLAYVLLSSEGASRCAQLMLGSRAILHPVPLDDALSTRVREIAAGRIAVSDVDRLIQEARSSWQSGDYEFAFLQSVIAAELLTIRTIDTLCLQRGVSKKKLKDLRDKLTYSWALNVGLPLAIDEERRPAASLITAMNNARQARNDLMHEARFDMTRAQVDELIKQTWVYITALRGAATTPNASSP